MPQIGNVHRIQQGLGLLHQLVEQYEPHHQLEYSRPHFIGFATKDLRGAIDFSIDLSVIRFLRFKFRYSFF